MKQVIAKVRLMFFKWTHWEFWPFNFFYFPVMFYFVWLALRHRSFFFFTTSNPSIDFGGMLGEKKSDIFKLIPEKYLPKHHLFHPSEHEAAARFAENIVYPVIAKPDVGERGVLVEKVGSKEELLAYCNRVEVPFLIQEFIDLPLELGVFYVKVPGEKRGSVTSIVEKSFLEVIGDGVKTVEQLIHENPRAALLTNTSGKRFQKLKNMVLADGERLVVEPIGNHSRGTTFLNANDKINDQLHQAIDDVAQSIDGFYFGRFDLKCDSYEALACKQLKILELNGAGAEPGHIYHPGYSLWQAYKDVLFHLKMLSKVSQANHRRGISYPGYWEGIGKMKQIKKYQRAIQKMTL